MVLSQAPLLHRWLGATQKMEGRKKESGPGDRLTEEGSFRPEHTTVFEALSAQKSR